MTKSDLGPAGFWMRAGAVTIDSFLGSLPGVFMVMAVWPHHSKEASLLNILISAAYNTCMVAACEGQTLGKKAAGIAIVRNDGSSVRYDRAFLRWIGSLVSGIILWIGYLMVPFTEQKRALHDFIADTRVIQVIPLSRERKAVILLVVFLPLIAAAIGIVAAILIPVLAGHAPHQILPVG